ncbi:hypothetical protein [Pseudomonas sp. SCA2728.1_7]|uniref:hypothetical protein n=1 Tax=Pseudomonas sp. SCA2728.1_7 TaxID=2825975 RepID=UPI001BB0BE03|nr:hypothetical protein [Pseudomonas sp. SCA2728.1_7]QUE92773.1 hypothetical protein KBP52_10305 [Pseudomonas sp. SCA2728.1_7]
MDGVFVSYDADKGRGTINPVDPAVPANPENHGFLEIPLAPRSSKFSLEANSVSIYTQGGWEKKEGEGYYFFTVPDEHKYKMNIPLEKGKDRAVKFDLVEEGSREVTNLRY